jgi:hypothetical protein
MCKDVYIDLQCNDCQNALKSFTNFGTDSTQEKCEVPKYFSILEVE